MVSLTFAKIVALCVIIVGGIIKISLGHAKINDVFEGTNTNILTIATGI